MNITNKVLNNYVFLFIIKIKMWIYSLRHLFNYQTVYIQFSEDIFKIVWWSGVISEYSITDKILYIFLIT